jgi:sugar transferase (PEP-CTERM/EpsH1 system associated)
MQELLYLVHRIPYPPNKGDKIRSYHLLKHLSQNHHIHLGTFIDDEKDWEYVEKVRTLCSETYFVKLRPQIARMRSLSSMLTNQPLTLPYYKDIGLQKWVNNTLDKRKIKNILVFSSAMAQYVDESCSTHCVIDFVDVDSDKWRQYSKTKPWPLNWLYRRESKLLLEYERKIAKAFDSSTFVSETESNFFKQLAPETATKVTYFNNGVDADYFSPQNINNNPYLSNIDTLVFTGAMDYWANVDAVEWFAHNIFTLIRAQLPSVEFYIVGSHPTARVIALASLPGITVTGSVKDIRPYIAHASLVVVPLRIARGIQNKVLEAMAMEKIVVVSPQAAEGIRALHSRELFVENNERDFADRIISQIKNGPNMKIGAAARARVLEDYSWGKILDQFDTLLIQEQTNDTDKSHNDNLQDPFITSENKVA